MSSSDEPLRVGLAGAGAMGRRHADLIQAGEPARLVAVADPDAAAAGGIARIGGEIQIFSDLDRMLADAAIDVVHVCSPPRLHFAQARASLQSGCHVYVEKPFTETHEETAELVDLATTFNLKICAGHQLKFVFPQAEKATVGRSEKPFKAETLSAVICPLASTAGGESWACESTGAVEGFGGRVRLCELLPVGATVCAGPRLEAEAEDLPADGDATDCPGADRHWAEYLKVVIGERREPLYLFWMTISYSRKEDQVSWLACHNASIDWLEGVPEVNRIDNVKTAFRRGAVASPGSIRSTGLAPIW